MACYLINRSPRATLDGKVAEEVWTGNERLLRVESVQMSNLCTYCWRGEIKA